jgi:hypothetical protein
MHTGYQGLFRGGNAARQAHHLLPPSAKVKNERSYTSTPYVFTVWRLIKYSDGFTLRYFKLQKEYNVEQRTMNDV